MDSIDESNLHQLYAGQLKDIRTAELRATKLFRDMATIAADETIASLFRAAAAESSIQLARIDRLIRPGEGPTRVNSAPGATGADIAAGAGDADLLERGRESVSQQIGTYESACVTSRQLGDYVALDVLLLNLDEERSTAAALNWQVSRQGNLLRAI